MRKLLLATVFVSLTATGCASTAGTGGSTSNRDVITSEELRDLEGQLSNTYDVVRRLRSAWLRPRGSSFSGDRPTPMIYVNGTRFGETESLYSINVTDVEEIRYLDASDATTQFGTGNSGGAILVSTF